MSLFQITYEGKQSLKDIQDKFKEELSEKEILKSTAYALNQTATRVQAHIRKQVRKEYTISNPYLSKMSKTIKGAKGTKDSLYTEIGFSYIPVPMIAFKHTGTPKSKRPVTVTILKGQTKIFRHAFIRLKSTNKDGNEKFGIYSRGRYNGKRFVYNEGDKRTSELRTASPYSMSLGKTIQPRIIAYTEKELPGRLEAVLRKKIEKMANR